MNSHSKSVPDVDVLLWHPLLVNDTGKLCKLVGTKKGVYIMRLKSHNFGRLHGASDILYIGSTTALKGMASRIRGYLKPGSSQFTNIRINKLLQTGMVVEIATIPNDHPRDLEHKLLEKYYNDHLELPPFNRSGGLKNLGAPTEE